MNQDPYIMIGSHFPKKYCNYNLHITAYDVDDHARNVHNLLGDLKNNLGRQILASDGDLNRILQATFDNTGIKFTNISKNHGVGSSQDHTAKNLSGFSNLGRQ
jgi:hypothetical protein